jgi:hypothetical protein
MGILVLWDVTLCHSASGSWSFRGLWYLHLQEKAAHLDPEDVGTIIPWNIETHSATLLWEPHIWLVYHLWRRFREYSLCITFVTYRYRERRSPRGLQRLGITVQTGPDQFYIRGPVHHNPKLTKSNKMQQCAGIYLLQNYSTCFGCPSHPSSWVHKTVTAASGTGHSIWTTTFLQRDLIRSPVSEATFTVLRTPDDGYDGHPKHVEWFCSK